MCATHSVSPVEDDEDCEVEDGLDAVSAENHPWMLPRPVAFGTLLSSSALVGHREGALLSFATRLLPRPDMHGERSEPKSFSVIAV